MKHCFFRECKCDKTCEAYMKEPFQGFNCSVLVMGIKMLDVEVDIQVGKQEVL